MKDDRHILGESTSHTEATSLTLLDRVKRQDGNGWSLFCSLYTPLIQWWCMRHGVAGSDIHDLAQDVFLTVFGRVEEFEHAGRRGSFRAWLRTITGYKYKEYERRRRGEPPGEGGSGALERLLLVVDVAPEGGADVVPEVEETERALVVRAALEQIRGTVEPKTYEAATRTLLGEPTAGVAAALGMTTGAVHVAKSRILQKLRAICDEHLD